MKRLIIASFAACGLLSTPAFADTSGTILSVSGEQGAVVVLRNGEAIEAAPNLSLLENDRLIVRADGAVEVTSDGCSVALSAPAMAVVNDGFCAAQPVRLQKASETTTAAAPRGETLSIGGAATAGGAGLGALALAAAAASGGGGSGSTSAPLAIGDATTGSGETLVGNGSGREDTGPVTGINGTGNTFDAGSGLDTGLFGFFESTSS